ncbi:hypothetical protein JYG36_09535 [Pseudomonas sp. SORT22]|uniref:hypothetical protein n=1 Tax=Pseudomonas sp. SORT22 TaxID=2813842 RepID=UPI001BD1A18B|nr:hypothetical protein [Pseudomonas sp. SORT22]QVM98389.1 hypothetical protein JYG36_09535 [Pseudomonas sp. SORT22]
MAAKIEYVVVDGCVQDGSKIYKKGEAYVPPNKELLELLLDEGKIAPRGKLPARDEQDDGE